MKNESIKFRLVAARMTSLMSERKIASLFSISRGSVSYWKKKLYQPGFRNKRHGGFRYQKFGVAVNGILKFLVHSCPTFTLSEYQLVLMKLGIRMSRDTIRRRFKHWKLSYKKVQYKQIAKYTYINMQKYFNHLLYMPQLVQTKGLLRIKYLDEVHFVSKDLERNKGFSLLGERLIVTRGTCLTETYSMTLITSLDHLVPFACNLRVGSNTQFDFSLFIGECIKNKILIDGHILVLDNASVHCGAQTIVLLHKTLQRLGISLLFLPAYSPELNPAELVFAKIKNYLRHYRDPSKSLVHDIMTSLSSLSHRSLFSMYMRCIYRPSLTK